MFVVRRSIGDRDVTVSGKIRSSERQAQHFRINFAKESSALSLMVGMEGSGDHAAATPTAGFFIVIVRRRNGGKYW